MKYKKIIFKNRKTFSLIALVLLLSLTASLLMFFRTSLNASASSTSNYDAYDAYTSSDIFQKNGNNYSIRDYGSVHLAKEGHIDVTEGWFDKFVLDLGSTDDAIGKIVPRELFTYTNETLHIGNEYGFFISTTPMASTDNFKSTVMVFDIITDTNLNQNGQNIYITVEPIFQYQYAYLKSGSGSVVVQYDYYFYGLPFITKAKTLTYSNLTQNRIIGLPSSAREYEYGAFDITCHVYYDYVYDYYLKDISFIATLINEQELNQYDEEYIASEDNGMFITSYDYLFPGKVRANNKFPAVDAVKASLGTVSFALGKIKNPYTEAIGTVIDVGLMIWDWTEIINEATGYNWVDDGVKKFTVTDFYKYKETKGEFPGQLDAYGMLIKSTKTIINTSDKADSVWYGVDNFAKIKVGVTPSVNKTSLIKEIDLKVVRLADEKAVAASSSHYYTPVGEVTQGLTVVDNYVTGFTPQSNFNGHIRIPYGVTAIGNNAFSGKSNITSVYIPNTVTSIGASAFSNCNNLVSIKISNNITSIGTGAFLNCGNLKIYTEAASKPGGWNANWNSSNRPVVWGCNLSLIGTQYTVNFDKQGGSGTANSKYVTYGDEYGTLPTLTKNGYTFAGWWTALYGGTEVTDATYVLLTGSQTLYAKWNIISYNINYVGAVTSHTNPATYSIETSTIMLTAPDDRENYTWGGWYDNLSFTGSQITNIPSGSYGNKTLYAKWTPVEYTVTFDKQGGYGGSNYVTVLFGYTMPYAVAPVKDGYYFDGYYTAQNGGGTMYYNSDMAIAQIYYISGNSTLYAKWSANDYTVTFDKQGGNWGTNYVTTYYGSAMPYATVPLNAGHSFGGYFTAQNGGGTKYYNSDMTSAQIYYISGNSTLYAKWSAIEYTVTFDKQGGSGGTNSVKLFYGNAMPFATDPTKGGHNFGGYFSAPYGGGTKYYNSDMTSARNYDIEDNSTLYAKWVADECIVTFNKQGGSGGSSTVTASRGYSMPYATAPTKAGHYFGGYYTGSDGGGTKYYKSDMNSARNCDVTGEMTLYARWTAIPPEFAGLTVYVIYDYFNIYCGVTPTAFVVTSENGGAYALEAYMYCYWYDIRISLFDESMNLVEVFEEEAFSPNYSQISGSIDLSAGAYYLIEIFSMQYGEFYFCLQR